MVGHQRRTAVVTDGEQSGVLGVFLGAAEVDGLEQEGAGPPAVLRQWMKNVVAAALQVLKCTAGTPRCSEDRARWRWGGVLGRSPGYVGAKGG